MNTNTLMKALRRKLRFSVTNGHLSVEDLFDLDLNKLDRMAVEVDQRLSAATKSFLADPTPTPASRARKDDELRKDILIGVINFKQEERAAARAAAEKESRRAFLNRLLDQRRLEKLEGMGEDEILAQLRALDGEDTAPAETKAQEPATAATT